MSSYKNAELTARGREEMIRRMQAAQIRRVKQYNADVIQGYAQIAGVWPLVGF